MSFSKGKDHSSGCTLSLSGTEEFPRVRPPPLDSEEEDVPIRVVWRPRLVGDPGVLALSPPPIPLNLDLVGPSSAISMMTRGTPFTSEGCMGFWTTSEFHLLV